MRPNNPLAWKTCPECKTGDMEFMPYFKFSPFKCNKCDFVEFASPLAANTECPGEKC